VSEGKGLYREQLDVERRRLIVAALEQCRGNRTHAAKYLGITRESLLRALRHVGIRAAVEARWPACRSAAARKN
jgi:DNA-binding NtrC family response regulator